MRKGYSNKIEKMITDKRKTIRQGVPASLLIVLLGLSGGFCQTACGGILYLIVARDTPAANLGPAIPADSNGVVTVFKEHIPKDQLVIEEFQGNDLTTQRLLDCIRTLPITPQVDSLVVFASGKWEYSTPDMEHRLILPGKQVLTRSQLEQVSIAKNPRGVFVFADSCTDHINRPPILPPNPPKVTANPTQISPLFESLFVNRTGLIGIASSQPGQVSITRGDGKGSLFTYRFVEFLNANADTPLGWNVTLRKLRLEVDADFNKLTKGKGLPRPGAPNQVNQTVHSFYPITRLGMGAQQIDGRLLVTAVVPLSPASIAKTTAGLKQNLKNGDILLQVNGKPLSTEKEYSHAVDDSPRRMDFKVQDADSKQILALTTTLNPLDE